MANARIVDQTKPDAEELFMRDAARPYVVLAEVPRGYRSGGGYRTEVIGRYASKASAQGAKRRAENAGF